jgi:hypothetical protein
VYTSQATVEGSITTLCFSLRAHHYSMRVPWRAHAAEHVSQAASIARTGAQQQAAVQYQFRVPSSWQETPVSIADLGGTEIDIRFKSRDEGELSVVVAPVLRFRDVGYNANVDMPYLGDPDTIIAGARTRSG